MRRFKFFYAFLFLIFLASAFPDHSFGYTKKSGKTSRQTIFHQRLQRAMNVQFFSVRAQLTPDVINELNSIIATGAGNLIRNRASEASMRAAEMRAADFAKNLIARGVRKPDRTILISGSAIAGWRRWFCPAYPFC